MQHKYSAEKKEGTILFCDIRNFTTLFENVDPLKAIHFANDVLARLGEEIEAAGGVVDRFTGDGFLAHFGVADAAESHTADACSAALNMRNTLQEINNQRYLDVEMIVTAGIGIHSGTVAYGQIQTNQFNQQTILGNDVNIASRIESLTKYFSVDILVSQHSYNRVKHHFLFQEMPKKKLKGIKNEVYTYWLLPMN